MSKQTTGLWNCNSIALTGGAILAALAWATTASAGLYDAWGYQAPITFNGYNKSETLTNFPALVVISNNAFSGFTYSQFLSGSNDLGFTDSTGTTNLNYEIDTWNQNGASYIWVQVPLLSSGTVIKAWWGALGQTVPACTTNGATWTSGYSGVWHMNQANALDSTTNSNAGTAASGVTLNGGEIGTACSFNGSTGRISVPSSTSLNFTTNALTIEAWVCCPTTLPTSEAAIVRKDSQWSLELLNATTVRNLVTTTGGTTGWTVNNDATYAFVTNRWYYSCLTYNGANVAHLINAQKIPFKSGTGICTGNIGTDGNPVYFAYCPGGTYVAGLIDEIRISCMARSTNWIWACYMNMASNASVFQTYGTAQPYNPSLPIIANVDPSNIVSGAAFANASLTKNGSSPAMVTVYWGPTDGGTNAAAWSNSAAFASGQWADGSNPTTNLTVSSGEWFYTYAASNSSGVAWGGPSKYFLQSGLTVVATDPSCGSTPSDYATVTVFRAANCTSGVLIVNYITAGAVTNGVSYTATPASGKLQFNAGSNSAVIAIVPQAPWNTGAAENFTVALTNGFYLIGSPNAATCTLQSLPPATYTWDGSTANWTNASHWTGGFSGLLPVNGSTGIIASGTAQVNASGDLYNPPSTAPTAIFIRTNGTLSLASGVAQPLTHDHHLVLDGGVLYMGGIQWAIQSYTNNIWVQHNSTISLYGGYGYLGVQLGGIICYDSNSTGCVSVVGAAGYPTYTPTLNISESSPAFAGGWSVNQANLCALATNALGSGPITVTNGAICFFSPTGDFNLPSVTVRNGGTLNVNYAGATTHYNVASGQCLTVQNGGVVGQGAGAWATAYMDAPVHLSGSITLLASDTGMMCFMNDFINSVPATITAMPFATNHGSGTYLNKMNNAYTGNWVFQMGSLDAVYINANGALGTGPVDVRSAGCSIAKSLVLHNLMCGANSIGASTYTLTLQPWYTNATLTCAGVAPGTNFGAAVGTLGVAGNLTFTNLVNYDGNGNTAYCNVNILMMTNTPSTGTNSIVQVSGNLNGLANADLTVTAAPRLPVGIYTIAAASNNLSGQQFHTVTFSGAAGRVLYNTNSVQVEIVSGGTVLFVQ